MATLTTVDGAEIDFAPDNVAAVAPDGSGAVVFGATHGSVQIAEAPQVFLTRLGIAANFVQLTRPDRFPVWINGKAVSSLRAPLPNEYPPNVQAVVFTGAVTQAVTETVAAARTALNAHMAKL
jgi:hypothetical protein